MTAATAATAVNTVPRSGPRVSVVVVSYRSAGEIDGCLGSVASAAAEVPLEAVVVDNRSEDGTVERVRDGHPGVGLIANADNRGFAAGCNQGIAATRGEFVLLLNPDARLQPGTLAALVRHLDENPRDGIVAPALESSPGELQRDISATGIFPSFWQALHEYTRLGRWYPDSPWVRDYFLAGFDRRSSRPVAMVQGACLLVRRALLQQIGSFDERFFLYFEETDLCKRAVDAGWGVHYLGEAAALHAGSRSSADRRPNAREFIRSLYAFHRKHYGPGEAVLLWSVLAPYHVLKTARMSLSAIFNRRDERLRADLRTVAERCRAHFRLVPGIR